MSDLERLYKELEKENKKLKQYLKMTGISDYWEYMEELKQENARLREVLEQVLGASSFLVCISDRYTCYKIDKVFNEIKKALERGE